MVGLYLTEARWLGHIGLYKWMRGVSSLQALRKEIKSICLTIHKVWKLAVFATPRSSRYNMWSYAVFIWYQS